MNAFLSPLEGLTSGLLKVSAQASVVIVLVLLVQWLGRKHLAPRARYALWLLVVLRLMLPASFESNISIFNYTKAAPVRSSGPETRAPQVVPTKVASAPAPSAPPTTATEQVRVTAHASVIAVPGASTEQARPAAAIAVRVAESSPFRSWPWALTLSLVWLAGVVFLLARIIWIPLRLNAQLARHETATSAAVFEILEQAKRLIGVNQVLPIVQSRAVESPALLGFIRPWLLLPDGLVEKFTPQELRLVFLHELAHLKRRDIAVNWLATLLQILHWPNPLVWFAFARMRADRELACDELALSFARAEENQIYGSAIIKLLEGFSRPAALPGLVGILEDQTQMKKRITMIAQFKKITGWSTAAAGLVLVLGFVTLTDAQTEKTTGSAPVINGQRITTIASGTAAYANGELSPDETAIAYEDNGDKGSNLAVRELASGRSRQVTEAPSSRGYGPGSPVWSWDSKSLVYPWWEASTGMSVRIVSRDGGPPRVVPLNWDKSQKNARQSGENFEPADWSRDGAMVVGEWSLEDKSRALATLTLATGEIRVLGAFTPKVGHPRFSPDGKFIVYDRAVDGNRDIYVTSVDGTRTTRLTDSPAEDGTPIFSADGRYVLFSSNQRGTLDLWAIAVADGAAAGQRFLSKVDFGNPTKRITAVGKLAFSSGGGGTDVFEIDVTARGNPPTAIARSSFGRNLHATWSPDGRKIAYARQVGQDDNRPWLLCIQSSADGREELFETGMRVFDWIFWSPDGQSLALGGPHESSKAAMYVFSLVTRQRVATPFSDDAIFPLGFSPDGKSFRLLKRNSDRTQLISIDLKTNVPLVIATPDELARLADVPNLAKLNLSGGGAPFAYMAKSGGSTMAYATKTGNEQQLVVWDSTDRKIRTIARVTEPLEIRSPSFSPDGTKVAYFVKGSDNLKQQLRVVAADGTSDRLLHEGNFWHVKIGPRWSPDGTKTAITLAQETVAEIGVLENYLPAEKVAAK